MQIETVFKRSTNISKLTIQHKKAGNNLPALSDIIFSKSFMLLLREEQKYRNDRLFCV